MNILEMLTATQNGGAASQLARQFNLDDSQVNQALGQLVPALSSGLKRNAQSQDGRESLFNALQRGGHERYLDEPEYVTREDARNEGNGILGHIFGSKDVSRNVSRQAAGQTGIGEGILKQMLPLVASMVMGSLAKQSRQSGFLGQGSGFGGLSGTGQQG